MVGCFFGDFCPSRPDVALQKIRMAGTWRLSMLGQQNLPGAAGTESTRRSLMVAGKTFFTFDLLGNLHYIGTLGADETVGLWQINTTTGRAAIGLTLGSAAVGPIAISSVQSSVAEMADGSLNVQIRWRERDVDGATITDVTVKLEQMRLTSSDGQVTALMSVGESSSTDPAPEKVRFIGEVLLEAIEPEIRELLGDVYPIGTVTAVGGPPPPYNDEVTFGPGQWFDLDASETTGPAGADLSYYWHVVRELTDPETNQVIERDRPFVRSSVTSRLIANDPGRYYITLYVTDGVLWRSTQDLGQSSALTRFVRVE
jgi:hypothetical protein